MREPVTKRAAASRARAGGNGGLVDEAAGIEHGEAAAGALGGEDGCGWEEMVWCPWCAKESEVQGSVPSRKGRSEPERRRRRHQTIANAAHHSVTTTTDPINAEPTARASPSASFYCAPTRLDCAFHCICIAFTTAPSHLSALHCCQPPRHRTAQPPQNQHHIDTTVVCRFSRQNATVYAHAVLLWLRGNAHRHMWTMPHVSTR